MASERYSQVLLEELERGNLFIEPLDDDAALVPLSPAVRRSAAQPAATMARAVS